MLEESFLKYFDVISFDIFDTLLLRTAYVPTDVWEETEQKSGISGFARARRDADAKSYELGSRRGGEASFDEAYDLMGQHWTVCKKIELETEKHALLANPEMVKLWNLAGKLGKKRIVISDMYLQQDFLEDQLRTNGIVGWDGFYVSSTADARKATGALFKKVLQDLRVAPEKILHIGDSAFSDVKMANSLGLVAFQYERVTARFLRENPFAGLFLGEKPSFEKRQLVGALAVGLHCYTCNHAEAGFWERFGYLYAGVLGYAYARFVGEEARKRGIKRLLLVMRDGYNLEPVLNALYPELKTDLIYAPRQQYVMAYKEFTDYEWTYMERRRFVWDSLDLQGDREAYLKTGKLSGLNAERFEVASRRAREGYQAYLDRLSIDDPKSVALVDLTTSALSATYLIERTLGAEITSFYLLARNPPLPQLPERVKPMYHAQSEATCFHLMCEYLFTAPTPSVKAVYGDQVVYSSGENFFNTYKKNVCEQVRDPIVEAARMLGRNECVVSPKILEEYLLAIHAGLSESDRSAMSFAREASDIEQGAWRDPFEFEWGFVRTTPLVKVFGRSLLGVRKNIVKGVRCRELMLGSKHLLYVVPRFSVHNRELLSLRRGSAGCGWRYEVWLFNKYRIARI